MSNVLYILIDTESCINHSGHGWTNGHSDLRYEQINLVQLRARRVH